MRNREPVPDRRDGGDHPEHKPLGQLLDSEHELWSRPSLTIAEAARTCGVSASTIRRYLRVHIDHEALVTDEISIGDYVLSGGEPAALVMIDAVVRLLPGALGSETSALFESFSEGLLDYPQYTRPPDFRGMRVPEVLLSGNHAEIARWRKEAALEKTRRKRPDLLKSE